MPSLESTERDQRDQELKEFILRVLRDWKPSSVEEVFNIVLALHHVVYRYRK